MTSSTGARQAVRQYVERVASQDLEEFPQWDLKAPLPKLPVPRLSDTLTQHLRLLEAVAPPETFEHTRTLVNEFGKPGGEGERLQKELETYAEGKECWAYDMWLKDMYMRNPICLPINSSPGVVFPRHLAADFRDERQQLKFATKLISGILDYKVILDTRSLPVDRANTREKGQPLCMEQYYRLFPSYRRPGDPLDSLTQPASHAAIHTHTQDVIVACRNQFFVLDVVVNGNRLSDENIYSQLRHIVAKAEQLPSNGPGVGVLTTADRRNWARVREMLMKDETNRTSLSLLEGCIFVLCLDKAIPTSLLSNKPSNYANRPNGDQIVTEKHTNNGGHIPKTVNNINEPHAQQKAQINGQLDDVTLKNGESIKELSLENQPACCHDSRIDKSNDSISKIDGNKSKTLNTCKCCSNSPVTSTSSSGNGLVEESVDAYASLRMRDDVSLGSQMLHGLGSAHNTPNRWFDKTMQFIIGADGACGLCYEHSASEGIAVVQLIEHLLKYMDELKQRHLGRMQSLRELPEPEMLQWNISAEVDREIERASEAVDRLISDLDMHVLRFENFGKNFIKSQNMSPDAFIQVLLQLTYYSIHKKLVPTYESASIRRFRQGRVDNIRACTPEALRFSRAMLGETESTNAEKLHLLRSAIKTQTSIMVETILGRGIDNHLLGLREMAERTCTHLPAIFKDPAYAMANQFTLSTSQVPTTMDAFMLYGPVVPDGYGVCYNPHAKYMLFVVTSFRRAQCTDSQRFAHALEANLIAVKRLSETAKEDKATKE